MAALLVWTMSSGSSAPAVGCHPPVEIHYALYLDALHYKNMARPCITDDAKSNIGQTNPRPQNLRYLFQRCAPIYALIGCRSFEAAGGIWKYYRHAMFRWMFVAKAVAHRWQEERTSVGRRIDGIEGCRLFHVQPGLTTEIRIGKPHVYGLPVCGIADEVGREGAYPRTAIFSHLSQLTLENPSRVNSGSRSYQSEATGSGENLYSYYLTFGAVALIGVSLVLIGLYSRCNGVTMLLLICGWAALVTGIASLAAIKSVYGG